jgi:hypothetical protein
VEILRPPGSLIRNVHLNQSSGASSEPPLKELRAMHDWFREQGVHCHQDAVQPLAEVPGYVDSAQQVLAEVGGGKNRRKSRRITVTRRAIG